LFLALALAGRGDRGAVQELEATFSLRDPKWPQAWLWARVAAMYAAFGLVPKADAVLAVVRAETAPDIVSQVATLNWLEGELELAKGRPAAAV